MPRVLFLAAFLFVGLTFSQCRDEVDEKEVTPKPAYVPDNTFFIDGALYPVTNVQTDRSKAYFWGSLLFSKASSTIAVVFPNAPVRASYAIEAERRYVYFYSEQNAAFVSSSGTLIVDLVGDKTRVRAINMPFTNEETSETKTVSFSIIR